MKYIVFAVMFFFSLQEVSSQETGKRTYTIDRLIPSYIDFRQSQMDNVLNVNIKDKYFIIKELLQLNEETTVLLTDTLTDVLGGFHESYSM